MAVAKLLFKNSVSDMIELVINTRIFDWRPFWNFIKIISRYCGILWFFSQLSSHIIIIIIIWFGDTVTVSHLTKCIIQTRKCVLCREYAKPNRCVFRCFAKVSKPTKEEDLKPTSKTFQLLGPATTKDLKPQSVRWLGTTMSPWAADLKA